MAAKALRRCGCGRRAVRHELPYFVSPELIRFYGKQRSVDVQFEFGVMFGTITPWKVLGLEIPRIGMSYRVGRGASTFRLVLGGPFN